MTTGKGDALSVPLKGHLPRLKAGTTTGLAPGPEGGGYHPGLAPGLKAGTSSGGIFVPQ